MHNHSFSDLFCHILTQNGLQRFCTEEMIERFERFTQAFQVFNAHTNLSAIRETPDIIAKHYADCLFAEEFIAECATVLDVGCGGGFPCIPLAIARRDLQITAVDSTAKKIKFVQSVAQQQSLDNLTPICARIEDPTFASRKQSYSVGISRAVARLPILLELILPYIQVGGSMIALKGPAASEELEDSRSSLKVLGGEIESVERKVLVTSTDSDTRTIILIRKVRPTPMQYPRQFSAISKKPL